MNKERVLPIQGSENIRELGGYQTVDGRTVKWRKVLRGAVLAHLTDADKTFLENYGLKTIIDFRSIQEQQEQPDDTIKGAEHVSLPVFPTTEASPQEMMKDLLAKHEDSKTIMEASYEHFVTDPHSVATYGKFFEWLTNNKDENVLLFHCTAGKDRTGFGAALFLAALGVDRSVIMQDYLLTNQYLNKQKAELRKMIQKEDVPQEIIDSSEELLMADPSYLNAAFAAIDKNYGTVGNFLVEGLGFDSLAQEDLRELYLEK